jgi:hypothetical protein
LYYNQKISENSEYDSRENFSQNSTSIVAQAFLKILLLRHNNQAPKYFLKNNLRLQNIGREKDKKNSPICYPWKIVPLGNKR